MNPLPALVDGDQPLSSAERARYSRHLLLPHVGAVGQARLSRARVLLVGAGGLGSPVALYLAAAGVGTLGLVDFDTVDLSNLQRQLLHRTADVGRPKVESARDTLAHVNPHVTVETHRTRLSRENARALIGEYELVVDGTDTFATRYLASDTCVALARPYVYGSIFRFQGQASVFVAGDAPCYRCLYPEPPPAIMAPTCAEGGVLGVLPGLVGTVMATEVLKVLLGIGETLAGRLLLVDALTMQFRQVRVRRDPGCPACGTRTLADDIDYDLFCAGEATPHATDVPEVSARTLAAWRTADVPHLLLDVREPSEWAIGHIDGARLVPLGALEGALPSLPRDTDIVVMCRAGARSATAVRQLHAAGITRAVSLAGGIVRWADEVDPTMPRY